MSKHSRFVIPSVVLLVVLILSLALTTAVYADDGTPPPASEESVQPPAEEPVVSEQSSVDSDQLSGEEAASDEPAPTEEVTVAEVLEAAPEGTEVVVLNEDGSVEPLATVQATEIVAVVDPMWCPDGKLPGEDGCSDSYEFINELIADMRNNASNYDEAGIIYFTSDPGTQNFVLTDAAGSLGASFGTLSDFNLTLQGGWNGLPSDDPEFIIDGQTDFFGSHIRIGTNDNPWGGNITINNITIDMIESAGANNGLVVFTDGRIELNQVNVNNNWGGNGARLNNDSGNQNVVVRHSTFNDNAGDGLYVASRGDIRLIDVTAKRNDGYGAWLDTRKDIDVRNSTFNNNDLTGLDAYSRRGSITLIDVIATRNDGYGLIADSNGDITLHDVTTNDNAGDGAYLDNKSGTGSITVSDSIFGEIESGNGGSGLAIKSNGSITLDNVTANSNGNRWGGHGMEASSKGNITLDNVTASGNSWDGAYLDNCQWNGVVCSGTGSITVSDSIFGEIESGNGGGLEASSNGDITLHNVTASGNEWGGAYLANDYEGASGSITVDLNSVFNNNGDEIDGGSGLYAYSNGNVEVSNITANGNMGSGAYLNAGENATIVCSEFKTNGDYGVDGADVTGTFTLDDVTFGGNAAEYIGTPNILSGGCTIVNTKDGNKEEAPKGTVLPLNIVPVGGGEQVDLDCVSYRGTKLILPSGDSVILPCPTRDDGHLTGMTLGDLPGQLPGYTFISAMEAKVMQNGESLGTTNGVVVDFFVPVDQQGKDLTILCWNGSEWVDLGGSYSGDHFVVETNYIGFYVLVAK